MTRLSLRLAAFCVGLGIAVPSAHAQMTCTLPTILQNGTVADASQVMNNFNTLSGCVNNIYTPTSAGSVFQFVPQTYQNQGFIAQNTHNTLWTDANNSVGAGGFYLLSGDQSQLTVSTVTCTGSCTPGDSVGLNWTVAGTLYQPRYTVQVGDAASNVALGICNAVAANGPLIAALLAFHPANPFTTTIGYRPFQGTCAQQTGGTAILAYDQPWAASGNSVTAVSGSTTTVTQSYASGSATPKLDGGPQLVLGRFVPGYTPSIGDLGPWIDFVGQAGASSATADTQLASIFTRWVNQNTNILVIEAQQAGVGHNTAVAGGGLYGWGLVDPGFDANSISNVAFANFLSTGPSAGYSFDDRSFVGAQQGPASMMWQWAAQQAGSPGPLTTNAITAAGSKVLHFASVSGVVPGDLVSDSTTPAALPAGVFVIGTTSTTISLGAGAIGPGVGSGDVMTFIREAAQLSFQAPNAGFTGLVTVNPGGSLALPGSLALGQGAANATLVLGEVGMPVSVGGDTMAAGATAAKLQAVCGTNAGTAKLIMFAGTSATPVTVVDNVGSAVTGC